jgi:uncharacterized protein (DUF924 family)
MTDGSTTTTPADVLAFWRAAGPGLWFKKDEAFDADIRARFLRAHEAAARGECDEWAETPEGALALIVLLDQFPRNMFRESPRAFATDEKARAIARAAVDRGFDADFANPLRRFFYTPAMHSENLADQDFCVERCRMAGDEDGAKFALIHRDIIARFGRFPHRNAVLGRTTTREEQAFLDAGGFGG